MPMRPHGASTSSAVLRSQRERCRFSPSPQCGCRHGSSRHALIDRSAYIEEQREVCHVSTRRIFILDLYGKTPYIEEEREVCHVHRYHQNGARRSPHCA